MLCTIILLTISALHSVLSISDADDACNAAIEIAICRAIAATGLQIPLPCVDRIKPPLSKTCKEVLYRNSSATSGFYDILLLDGSTQKVYCDMEGSNCGGTGGWTRVAYTNMEEPGATCPPGALTQTNESGLSFCGRTSDSGCDSTFFSTFGISYQQVCGRLRGYQRGSPNAFSRSILDSSQTVETQYLDGVSITHGTAGSRVHIWSYPVSVTVRRNDQYGCPCNFGSTVSAPSFVGDDYYCDSTTIPTTSSLLLHPDNPLWDGNGGLCANSENPCCAADSLPWFNKTLSEATCDDIELRLCFDKSQSIERVPLDIIELYVR